MCTYDTRNKRTARVYVYTHMYIYIYIIYDTCETNAQRACMCVYIQHATQTARVCMNAHLDTEMPVEMLKLTGHGDAKVKRLACRISIRRCQWRCRSWRCLSEVPFPPHLHMEMHVEMLKFAGHGDARVKRLASRISIWRCRWRCRPWGCQSKRPDFQHLHMEMPVEMPPVEMPE